MVADYRKQIQETYPESVTADEALMNECVSICTTYNLDPETLLYKLEALNYKSTNTRTEILPVTRETLKSCREFLQREMVKESMKKAQLKARPAATATVDRSRLPAQLMNQSRAMDVDANRPPTASGSVQVKKESGGISSFAGPSHVVFEGVPMDAESRKRRAYRYMYEKITERSDVLDQLIDDFAELIREQYDVGEIADPSATTDEEVTVVGRIALDPEVVSGAKIAEGSMIIESSKMLSSGARVPLLLDSAIKIRGAVEGSRGYGLFPGQIVALRGKNGGGGYFAATAVLAIPPLKPSPTAEGLWNPKEDPSLENKSAVVCIASGPYSHDADLLFKPWRQFLEVVSAKKPHVLLLLGPFIDAAHPRIKSGESEVSHQSLFQARFINPIKKFLSISPTSIVVLIPSVRDMTSDHCAFPQPEFERTFDGIAGDSRIIFQPNPARFKINGISFGATSVDVLFHLRKEEYFKSGVPQQSVPARDGDIGHDNMANLCRHMLDQRSFYPIFPSPQELSHEVNLDVAHLDEARMIDDGDIDYAPDVLIVPSRLKRFDDKVIGSTLAINPASIVKGSCVFLEIKPKSLSSDLRVRLKAKLHDVYIPNAVVKSEPTVKSEQ